MKPAVLGRWEWWYFWCSGGWRVEELTSNVLASVDWCDVCGDRCDEIVRGDRCDEVVGGDRCDEVMGGDKCDEVVGGDRCDEVAEGDKCEEVAEGDKCKGLLSTKVLVFC